MLESIRAFGMERLEECGELDAVRQSHLELLLARTVWRDGDSNLAGGDVRWLRQMDLELDDVRSASRWAQQTDNSNAVLRLAVAIATYWVSRPYTLEEIALLATAIESAPDANAQLQVVSRFYTGVLLGWVGDLKSAFALAETALRVSKTEGDVLLQGLAHGLFGTLWEVSGNCEQSAESYRLAVEALRPPPESLWFYLALGELGARLVECGDVDEAATVLAIADAGYRALESLWGLAILPAHRAHAEIARGHLNLARTLFCESIDAARTMGDVRIELAAVLGFASIELELGRPESAARIIGLAQREQESHGIGRKLAHSIANERIDARVCAALGDERYHACIEEGRAIPYAQLLSELLPPEFAKQVEPSA
jgi:tetratricopeptide (TPR) repeat protein